jgi:hypothetical protein
MMFKSIRRLFGDRATRKAAKRDSRLPKGWRGLRVEELERRELLSVDVPRIISVTPPLNSSTTVTHPQISITFSEDVQTKATDTSPNGGVDNPANYVLINARPGGTSIPITVNGATYNSAEHKVTLDYNNGNDLTAGQYTVFVHGDRIHDVDDNLPLAQPGQVLAANAGTTNISTVGLPGTGNLDAISNYQSDITGAVPDAVVFADVYGDGPSMPALIVASQMSDTVDIYRARAGGGFFTTPVHLALPGGARPQGPQALYAHDLFGTGFIDIVVADTGTNQVSVFTNNGLGGFNRADYGAGSKPVAVTSAPVAFNDNFQDLLVADSGQDAVQVLPGTSGGIFGNAQAFATGRATLTGIVAAKSLTFTGKYDIAVSSSTGVAILPNSNDIDHNIRFGVPAPTFSPIVLTTVNTTSIATGEIGTDSAFPDIVATSPGAGAAGSVLVFTQDQVTGGTFTTSSFAAGPNPTGVQLGDVYGKGVNDILVANNVTGSGAATMSVLKGNKTGTFAAPVSYLVDQGPGSLAVNAGSTPDPVNPALNIVNEVATANSAFGARDVTLLRAAGNGNFLVSTDTPVTATKISATVTGDLNGDGIPDVVFADHDAGTVTVMFGMPGGGFSAPMVYTVGAGPVALALGTFNGQSKNSGLLDIAVVNQNDNDVSILFNDGTGHFGTQITLAVGKNPTGVVTADFLNPLAPGEDPNIGPDLAVSHGGQGGGLPSEQGVTVYLGNGNGTFGGRNEFAQGTHAAALAVGNFDNNGNVDLAVVDGSAQGTVTILHGTGKGTFTSTNDDVFAAGENPNSIAVGDLNGDGLPDIVVTDQTMEAGGAGATAYVDVLLNTPGIGFSDPLRTDVFTAPGAQLQSVAIAHVNQGAFPDLVLSAANNTGLFLFGSANNLFTLSGRGDGSFDAPKIFATFGGGPTILPSYLSVVSDPFLLATSFTVTSTTAGSNLVEDGGFDNLDLSAEKGNLNGWNTFDQTNSAGGWRIQSGTSSPISGITVAAPPEGRFAAMTDAPDIFLTNPDGTPKPSVFGAFDLVAGPGQNVPRPDDYNGTHILYQDVRIPANATSVTLTYDLYINNADPVNGFGYSNPNVTPQLDYFPNVPPSLRDSNQQVRVDIMDPNASITDVNAGLGGGVLQNIFITNTRTPRIMNYTVNPGSPGGAPIDLTQFRGRTIRIRIAETNNKGKLIVGVDNVQINATFPDTEAPTIAGLHLRNPGIDSSNTFGGKTTDTTIVGQVNANGADGSPSNIAFVLIDPDGTGFNNPDVFKVRRFDAEGHFQATLPPLSLPGQRTVGIMAVDQAGNATTTQFTFVFQGPSLTTFQAAGPGPIRFTGNGVNYRNVSGEITTEAVDPRDPSGNVIYVGSDNGGVWKTTDGGSNWTPLTQFLTDNGQPTGNPIPAPIGAIALDPNDPNTIYAGTGIADTKPTSHPGFGILKSTDAGQTWTLIGGDVFAGARISKIAVSDATLNHPATVYVAVASGGQFGPGLYRSQDGGATWTNILNPANMDIDPNQGGGTLASKGIALTSVTDLAIDRLVADEEVIWVGMGNIGLTGATQAAGVWKTTSGQEAQPLWFQQAGGHDSKGAAVLHQNLPVGTSTTFDIGRVAISLPGESERLGPDGLLHPVGKPEDDGIAYVFINNRNAALAGETTVNLDNVTGVFKTVTAGESWTHIMLRQNVHDAPNEPLENWEDILLVGGTVGGSDQNAVGTLAVDPNNVNVVYFGGSTRFQSAPDLINESHAFLRIDTSNMRDTRYASPNLAPITYPNDGDDIYKAYDAAILKGGTIPREPGVYPDKEAYTGEGVYWQDLQMNTDAISLFSHLELPGVIHALVFDPQGRLLVGTEGGIWRGVDQGFTYDTTSGGAFGSPGIEFELGVKTPNEPGMLFTDLNGNLQIADEFSVAIDPNQRGGFDSAAFNLGWAKTAGTLSWNSTNDVSFPSETAGVLSGGPILPDPFNSPAPFAGLIKAGPRDPSNPTNPSEIYRVYTNPPFLNNPPLQFQVSRLGGDQGTFQSVTAGLDLTGLAAFPNLPNFAVLPAKLNETSTPLDELLFAGNKVFESDDSANSWQQASGDLTNGGADVITALAFGGPSTDDVFYVGTAQGKVYVSLNNGADGFPLRNSGLPARPIDGITVDSTNPMDAFVAIGGFSTGQGHVFRTTDGGNSWSNITANLPDDPAYAVAFDPRKTATAPNGHLYVGTEVGIFVSLDLGASWKLLGEGLPHVPVLDLEFDQTFEELAAATEGAGTFVIHTDIQGPVVVSVSPTTPTLPGIQSVTVTFNKPVDPRTFPLSQIDALNGPDGPITPLSITDADPVNHQVFVINFLPQKSDGVYSVTIGPNIQDFVGNPMDQNGNFINGEDPNDRFSFRFTINTTDNGRFITGNYHDQLNRPADTEGFLSFISAVDTARYQQLPSAALVFLTSDEGRGDMIFNGGINALHPAPTGLYPQLLRRAASPAEVAIWVTALDNGATPEQVVNGIAASDEYFRVDAGGTDPSFVNQLYLDLLGRTGDSFGISFFLDTLSVAEEAARHGIVDALDHSLEYRTNLVASIFAKYLRPATPADISVWVSQFNAGITNEELIATLLGSDEYFNSPSHGGGTNAGWINAVFSDLFNRAPDPTGAAGVQAQLAAGVSRSQIALGLLSSDEYRTILIRDYFTKYLGRLPGAAEINLFLGAFQGGASDEAILSTIVASGEYFRRQNGSATTLMGQDLNWISAAYVQVLPRSQPPSSAEVNGFYVGLDQAEQVARGNVVHVFVTSDEYRKEFITRAYTTYLDRPAGVGDLNAQLPVLEQTPAGAGKPNPDELFLASVLGSGEYFLKQKDPATNLSTNAQWVTSLYNRVLGRTPDSNGFNVNLGTLLAGYQPQRLAAAQAFNSSTEYRQNLVTAFYQTYLRRLPTQAELTKGVSQLAQGTTDEQFINNLLSSTEYFLAPKLGAGQNSVWLNQVYLDLLNRGTSNDSGAASLLDALNNNKIDRPGIVAILLGSGEYRTRLINGFYMKYLGRTASQPELNNRFAELNGGVTDEAIINDIIASAEYYQHQLDPQRLAVIYP